jgi:hypothetical protein
MRHFSGLPDGFYMLETGANKGSLLSSPSMGIAKTMSEEEWSGFSCNIGV